MKLFTKLFFFFIIVFPCYVKGQCDSINQYFGDGKKIRYTVVEELPQFPGGDEARNAFLNENIKVPSNWSSDSIIGKVYTTFLVDAQGNIKYPCILRGLNPILDSIALATIRKMPKWIPAKMRGNPVSVQFNLPINFALDHYRK